MGTQDLYEVELVTSPKRLLRGRSALGVWPLLRPLDPPVYTMAALKKQYPQATVQVSKSVKNDEQQVVRVKQAGQTLSFYHHPQYGYCEDLLERWTVVADYPSLVAARYIESEVDIPAATALRFGAELLAALLGSADPIIKLEVLTVLSALDSDRVVFEGNEVIIRLDLA